MYVWLQRCVHLLYVCVCLHEFGLGTCALTATCWVSLVLRASWPDDTVTHVSRTHPVQSAVICNYLVTHTHSGSQTHSWVFMHFSFDERFDNMIEIATHVNAKNNMNSCLFKTQTAYRRRNCKSYRAWITLKETESVKLITQLFELIFIIN